MEIIISVNNKKTDGRVLSMSEPDTELFLKLITGCAKRGEMTGSQMDLIEYLEDKKYNVYSCSETVSFDIEEMPWNTCCIEEDKKYFFDLLNQAKEPGIAEALRIRIDQETVFPQLDTFAQMIGEFDPDSSCREYNADATKAELRLKKGLGWKACFDEKRGIYTAERSWRGFYQLCEINKETYDKLDPTGKNGEDPDKLIGAGRVLVEADDDYYTMPYCSVKDENYHELAPWSRAKAVYEKTYNDDKGNG